VYQFHLIDLRLWLQIQLIIGGVLLLNSQVSLIFLQILRYTLMFFVTKVRFGALSLHRISGPYANEQQVTTTLHLACIL